MVFGVILPITAVLIGVGQRSFHVYGDFALKNKNSVIFTIRRLKLL